MTIKQAVIVRKAFIATTLLLFALAMSGFMFGACAHLG